MDRRAAAIVTVVALVAAVIVWRVSRRDGPPAEVARGAPSAVAASPAWSGTPEDLAAARDGGVVARSIRDARAREEMRRRILEAWAQPDPEATGAAAANAAPTPPRRPDGTIDPAWLDERMQSDFKPMARACVKDLLSRDADAGAGKIVLRLEVVGDEKIGGVIDEVTVDDGSTIADEGFRTCLRESMMTIALPPPTHGGTATIVIPLSIGTSRPAPSR